MCTVRCTHSSMNHPHHVHSFAGEGGHVCVVGITVAMQSLLISICLGLASEFPISLAQRRGYKTHPRAKHKRLVFIRFSGKKKNPDVRGFRSFQRVSKLIQNHKQFTIASKNQEKNPVFHFLQWSVTKICK